MNLSDYDGIEAGQVWADKDPREAGRTVRVDALDSRYAYCTVITGRASQPGMRTGHRTRIDQDALLRRFRLVDGGPE